MMYGEFGLNGTLEGQRPATSRDTHPLRKYSKDPRIIGRVNLELKSADGDGIMMCMMCFEQ